MNIYIDCGAHKGYLLKKIVTNSNDIDLFVAFEPIKSFYNKLITKFGNDPKALILNKVVSCFDKDELDFYVAVKERGKGIGQGSTLVKGLYGGSKKKKVKNVNLSKFLENNFKVSDNIVIKFDIEGHEYDLLEYLIETGNIKYINKIYCEWHKSKLIKKLGNRKVAKDRHKELVRNLQELGFNLKGNNNSDELSRIKNRVLKKGLFSLII